MDPSQDTVITIDEKTLVETNNSEVLPPSYDHSVNDCPPPPNYIHSTRLLYQNEPYISGFDTMEWSNTNTNDSSSEIWSHINELPFRQRIFFYLQSWANTIYDCRFVFFVLSVCCSLAVMFIVFSLIVFPNHFSNNKS